MDTPEDDLFLREILEQPEALRVSLAQWIEGAHLRTTLREKLGGRRFSLVVMTGMGSSLDACYPSCIFLNRNGQPAIVTETAELLYYYPALRSIDCLLIVVSQSGESAEPVRLLKELGQESVVISLTNGLDNFVARHSTWALDIRAGKELTVSTKTYLATLFALLILSHALVGVEWAESAREFRQTADGLEKFLNGWRARVQPLVDLVGSCHHISLIGRGPSFTSALEGALILKEAGHRLSEAISGGHFRHGPLEIVSERNGYILFPGEKNTSDLILRLGRDISDYGGRVAFIGNEKMRGKDACGLWIPLPPANPFLLPVLEIVPVQLLAWSLARIEGRTISGFGKISKVTRTE